MRQHRRLTRGPICLTDDGIPNLHVSIHDLEWEYNHMRWEEFRAIKKKFNNTWYYQNWKCKPIKYIRNFILFIWFILLVLIVGFGGMALGIWLVGTTNLVMMIGAIPGGILLMGGILNYVLCPIYDFFAGLTRFRLRWTLMSMGYSPFYQSWDFKTWYTKNYKYYKNFMPYPKPSRIKWIRDEIDVFFHNCGH